MEVDAAGTRVRSLDERVVTRPSRKHQEEAVASTEGRMCVTRRVLNVSLLTMERSLGYRSSSESQETPRSHFRR